MDGFQDFQMILLKKRAGHFFDLFEKQNLFQSLKYELVLQNVHMLTNSNLVNQFYICLWIERKMVLSAALFVST